ncbi:hypothetical protein [Salinicola tamaricis]|uniref:hypothetical protein n=1 Tax=Salinicola tamaricis TaxID=1771309 RepID=UPI001F5CDB52|nr:hypothetical protein [Salinicola tamaricis]
MLAYLSIGILALLLTGIPVAITLFLLAFGVDQFFSFFPLMRRSARICGRRRTPFC